MKRIALLFAVVACSDEQRLGVEPLAADAPNWPQFYCDVAVVASCVGASVSATTTLLGPTGGSGACLPPAGWSSNNTTATASCPNGCALNASVLTSAFDQAQSDIEILETNPTALCTGTPDARAGDACTEPGYVSTTLPCVPTHAQLGSDGTVTGQTYLACQNNTCVAASPPTVANYLATCPAYSTGSAGSAGSGAGSDSAAGSGSAMTGVWADVGFLVDNETSVSLSPLNVCLFAWDAATQKLATGATIGCIGDWECPQGSLCDDELPVFGTASAPVAVCKPGPRGVLVPSMLSE